MSEFLHQFGYQLKDRLVLSRDCVDNDEHETTDAILHGLDCSSMMVFPTHKSMNAYLHTFDRLYLTDILSKLTLSLELP